MPQSMPDASTLLGAAVKYLEDELLPTLEGYHRFKTRVTVNVLNTIRRELELRGDQAAAARRVVHGVDDLESGVHGLAGGQADQLRRERGVPGRGGADLAAADRADERHARIAVERARGT